MLFARNALLPGRKLAFQQKTAKDPLTFSVDPAIFPVL